MTAKTIIDALLEKCEKHNINPTKDLIVTFVQMLKEVIESGGVE